MNKTDKIINGLWVGNRLSPLELLTLHSFVKHGHTFYLWVYETLENTLPDGVMTKDANEIIPIEHIFRKKENDPSSKIGKGSLGTFSDLFRYKLLYEKGGWWVDMDVTCLKPLSFNEAYFFRSHPLLPMIGNVMKCPPKSALMKAVYEETKHKCTTETSDWLLSNRILNKHVQALNLQAFIQKNISNNDDWLEVEGFIYNSNIRPTNWTFIHWMNEEWRTQKMDKNACYESSYLNNLYQEYNISVSSKKLPIFRLVQYRLHQTNRFLRTAIKKMLGIKSR